MKTDPVTLALVQNRLDQIALQMGWVMTRTARSPIFNQSHDFSCFIADANGAFLGRELTRLGLAPARLSLVGDDLERLIGEATMAGRGEPRIELGSG